MSDVPTQRVGFDEPRMLARILASDKPFGDSAYLHSQLREVSLRRLRRITPTLPGAGLLAEALDHAAEPVRSAVLEDPVLRAATQHTLTEQLTGRNPGLPIQTCAAVMREALQHVERGATESLVAATTPSCIALGPESWHGWIWCDEPPHSATARAFQELIQLNFGEGLARPTEPQVAVLQQARELIEQVIPELGKSALGHAHGIGVFPSTGRWQNMAGASQFWVNGVVFLAAANMQDPWWVAEHLLHEALHQKLYDLRHTHSVLVRDTQDGDTTPEARGQVVSLWNKVDGRSSNAWGVSRSLAAFHVYAHLAVYAQLAQARCAVEHVGGKPYTDHGVVTAESAFRRAAYLGEQLAEHYWNDLGPAGQSLVDWLTGCLKALAPLPTRQSLHLSLLLERYRREADWLGGAVGSGDPAYAAGCAETLIAAEANEATRFLSVAGTSWVAGTFEADENRSKSDRASPLEVDTDDGPPPGVRLAAAAHRRRRIADALAEALLCDESESIAAAREHASRMIERSSLELLPLLTEGGAGASTAPMPRVDLRGQLLTLTDIIGEGYGTSDLCLFLYSIVRMHAPVTIVELGTGRGASAFWMALAAKRNETGHVWTVDDLSIRQDWDLVLRAHRHQLYGTPWARLAEPSAEGCLELVQRELDLEDTLTLVTRTIDLSDPHHFDDYPFTVPVDLLFSDFRHGATAVLQILGQFLPKMAPASSIFIDGASTSWSSYLLLEQLVAQLNAHRIPALLQEQSPVALGPVLENRRLRLVHLTDRGREFQNSTAWLLLEPDDLRPYPLTTMRGL